VRTGTWRCHRGWTDNADVRIEFTLDCSNLDRMARFWTTAAGFVVEGVIEGRYVTLAWDGITLTLQRVAEPKTVKNRMHLDLLVDDVNQAVRRLESLGATRLTASARQEFGQTWYVLADPEGNEFCVAQDRPGQEQTQDD
jgi:predicted enzyme related to lactoylglutathione lyase